jgi:hypothetical protein
MVPDQTHLTRKSSAQFQIPFSPLLIRVAVRSLTNTYCFPFDRVTRSTCRQTSDYFFADDEELYDWHAPHTSALPT